MSGKEKIFIFIFALLSLSLCLLVVKYKGTGQLGNALSFLGSVATLVPPFNQLISNRLFFKVISIQSTPELRDLDDALEAQRRKAFMSFKTFDFVLVVGGLILMSTGFLASIVTSPDRVVLN